MNDLVYLSHHQITQLGPIGLFWGAPRRFSDGEKRLVENVEAKTLLIPSCVDCGQTPILVSIYTNVIRDFRGIAITV